MAAFTNGVLEIKAAIQHPFFLRKILSELLELPPEKVRVVAMEMGGGFGGRDSQSWNRSPLYWPSRQIAK